MHNLQSIPAILYTFMFVKNTDDFVLGPENIAQYRRIFSPQIRQQMLPDLEHVLQADPVFNFRQYFPTAADLSNDAIKVLMEKVYHFVKQYQEQLTD